VLWRTDGVFDFVIEAKHEKKEDNPLYKKDHAQLLEAEHWFKGAYPERDALRASALPEAVADKKATPDGTYAMRLAEVTKIVGALRGALTVSPGDEIELLEHCEDLLVEAKLKPDGIKATFLKPFTA
jgi:hypothetical protein